jgi:hypothetical protein
MEETQEVKIKPPVKKGDKLKGCLILGILCFVILFIIGWCTSSSTKTENNPNINSSNTTNNTNYSDKTLPSDAIRIISQNDTYEEATGTHTVHVEFQNISNKLITYIGMKSIYYDKNGKIVGTGMGNSTNIGSNDTKVLDILGMDIQNAKKYKIQVEDVSFE